MMEIETLWDLIDRLAQPLPAVRTSLDEGLGRVLREDVLAGEANPPFDQSAVDGYALSDAAAPALRLAPGTAHAGDPQGGFLQPGTAVRILTGAVVPAGTVAVAMQEDCDVGDGQVVPQRALEPGTFIRRAGGIWQAGAVLVESGTVLEAGVIGLLAGAGCLAPLVSPPVRVLHWVTGSELHLGAGTPLPGSIRDSNGPLIRALALSDGATIRQQWLDDDGEALAAAVAGADADLLLISGGSGHSERDHARTALEHAGFTLHTQTINSRPGKPLIFATRGATVAFGLPGNPLAHFVCYHVFVRLAICRMTGQAPRGLRSARLGSPVRDRGDGRRSWQPVRLECSPDGLWAQPLPWHHSGDLMPLVRADALLVADGISQPEVGELVRVLPLRHLPSQP